VYYERIMIAEESFLGRKFGAVYEAWSAGTPALLPRLQGGRYVASRYPFSMRLALRREYSAWLAAATPLFILEVYGDYVIHGRLVLDPAWVTGFVGVVLVSTVVRSLKHYTRILRTR
jgi:hypothetical protein